MPSNQHGSMGTGLRSRIIGTGSAFPERNVTNAILKEELAKRGIETDDQWIKERTGIASRRLSTLGKIEDTNSSLGFQASRRALEMADVRAEDIDIILYATCSPDTMIPSTACWLQSKLGCPKAWAVDLNAACSGFVYGLSMADQYIRSGSAKRVLIVGGEVLSSYVNWNDRASCVLFGDGAGAVVVGDVPASSPHQTIDCLLGADGTLAELFWMPYGGSRNPTTHEAIDQSWDKMSMRGKEVFKSATTTLAEYAERLLTRNGLSTTDVDWLIPHQANSRIIEAVAKRLDFPMSKVIVNIDRFGNTSSATVPTALDEAVRDGRIKPGQLLLCDVFGAGLTYGSALIRW